MINTYLKIYLIVFFIVPLQSIVFAQINKKVKDSLIQEMTFGKTDTAKVFAHYSYGDLWLNINNDSAYHYYNKGKMLAKENANILLEAKSHGYLINLLNDEGKYKEALELCLEAEILFKKTKAPKRDLTIVYINLGNEWQYLGAFKNASLNYFKALELSEQMNDCIFQSICLNNLASLYNEMIEVKNQLIFATKAKAKAIECNDDSRIFSASLNLIIAYLANDKLVNARTELTNLEKLKTKLDNPEYDLDVTITKAEYYLKAKNDKLAIYNFLLVLEKCKNYENIEYEIFSAKQLALIYFNKNQFDESLIFANRALKLTIKSGVKTGEAEMLKLFADIEEKKGNFKSSLEFTKKREELIKIIALEESKKELLKLEIEYQTERKELQIKTLTQQTELQNFKIKRRFWITFTLLLAFLTLCGIVYSQYKNYRSKKKLLLAQKDNAIFEERLRIATDMHDDVGSGLSRIRYIVGSIANGQTEKNQGLSKITEITDDAIQKMKEIIWSLNEENQDLENLIFYTRSQIYQMVENANVNFECQLPENIPNVFFGWKRNRNTYLLIKEAVNNALKHAEAKTITLDFLITDNLIISIKDDGKGFDTTQNFTGNGLNNYKKRIADLNATYILQSEIGIGTNVEFHIPFTI